MYLITWFIRFIFLSVRQAYALKKASTLSISLLWRQTANVSHSAWLGRYLQQSLLLVWLYVCRSQVRCIPADVHRDRIGDVCIFTLHCHGLHVGIGLTGEGWEQLRLFVVIGDHLRSLELIVSWQVALVVGHDMTVHVAEAEFLGIDAPILRAPNLQ